MDIQRTITAALDGAFDEVFFFLAVVDPEVIGDVLSDAPCLHEKAQQLLPIHLNRETDKDLLSHLAQAGYTLS